MVIAEVEDQIIARLRATFGATLREVDHKPAKLDADELARVLALAPAAYVSFLGFRAGEKLPERTVDAAYGVYLVAQNAAGEQARRRGDARLIGAYEMQELAFVALDGWAPASAASTIAVQSCENLFAAAFEKAGRSCYGLVLAVPIEMQPELGAGMGNFITFDASWDIPPLGNASRPPPSAIRDAGDRVTLPTT